MAIRLFDVPSLEDEVVVDESVQLDPVEQSETAEQIATAENEIEANLQIAEQSESTMDDLQKQVDANQEVIDEPGESTDEQVEAQVAASQEALKTASLLLSGRVDTFSVSVESYSSPMDRLVVSQEGIVDWIVAIFQKIVELLVKVATFFRKMFAHISAWVVSFTPGLSSLAKFYKDKVVTVDVNQAVQDKTGLWNSAYGLVKNNIDISYLDYPAKDLKKYMDSQISWLRDVYSQGEKFFKDRTTDHKITKQLEEAFSKIKQGLSIPEDREKFSYNRGTAIPSARGLINAILKNEVNKKINASFVDNQAIAPQADAGAVNDGYTGSSHGFIMDLNIDSVNNKATFNFMYNGGTVVNGEIDIPRPIEETTNLLVQNLVNVKGNDLSTYTENLIKLYKEFPKFVSAGIKGFDEMQKSVEKMKNLAIKMTGVIPDGASKETDKVKRYGPMATRYLYIAYYRAYFKLTMNLIKFIRQNLKANNRIPYKLKGFYGEPAKQ